MLPDLPPRPPNSPRDDFAHRSNSPPPAPYRGAGGEFGAPHGGHLGAGTVAGEFGRPEDATDPTPSDAELARWNVGPDRVVLVFVRPDRLDRVHLRAYERGPGGILTEAPAGVCLTLPAPDALPGLAERAVARALGAALEGRADR